jgi:hypothetical protein
MKEELEKKLYEKYPKIFAQKDLSPQETCMCWGLPGDGWYDLIDCLCGVVQNIVNNAERTNKVVDDCIAKGEKPPYEKVHIPYVEAGQVKEKFGTLRFYIDGGNDVINGAIWMAENMSAYICENCGDSGKLRGRGWVKTLCDGCAKESDSNEGKKDD